MNKRKTQTSNQKEIKKEISPKTEALLEELSELLADKEDYRF